MGIRSSLKKIKSLLKYDYEIAQGEMTTILDKIQYLEEESANIKCAMNKMSEEYEKVIKNFNYVNLETLQLNNLNSTGKQKLLICGFYGAINLGDELMLEILLKEIEKTNAFDVTIMLCDNQYIDITRYGKYNFIHYPLNIVDLNNIANYYDCLLFGGGAHIDDYGYDDDKHLSLGRILTDLTMRFIVFNKKTALYGLSSNSELTNIEYINKLKYIVDNCTYFSIRDTYSIDVLKKNGIDTDKIILVDDIVFASKYKSIKQAKKELRIGIVFICNEENKNKNEEYILTLISYLNKKGEKYFIDLIPFYDYMDNDHNHYLELMKKVQEKNVNIRSMPKDMEDLQIAFNENDYIISMRYHATLIANLMNKKVLNIIYNKHRHYDNKMKYLYEKYIFEDNNIIYGEDLKNKNLDLLFTPNKVNYNNEYREKATSDIAKMLKVIKTEGER